MKSVLISIQPKWCELIANGKKILEVRKTRPNIKTPFKCYIYCTKKFYRKGDGYFQGKYCGKVIGEFVCDAIITDKTFGHDALFKTSACMRDADISAYCLNKEMYGWHISDLVIYDKPKGLHHFFKPCGNCDKKGTRRCTEELTDCRAKVIERPPQSWCYVEEVKADE